MSEGVAVSLSADPIGVKILVVALCAALSFSVALVAAILARVDGASLAGAALTGGGAFAGALALALVVAGALGGL